VFNQIITSSFVASSLLISIPNWAAALPAPAAVAELQSSPTDPLGFCKAIVDQGLWDKSSVGFTTTAYLMNKNTICRSEYSTASAASNLKASGGINIFDILGIDGNDAQASSHYEQAWKNYCSASESDVRNNGTLLATGQRASAVIAGAFSSCINALADRTVRYVVPTPEGSGFTIWIETHSNGVHDLHISAIDLVDNSDNSKNPMKYSTYCFRNGQPISLPLDSGGSNQLSVLCSKPKEDSVSVLVTSDAGNLPTVDVPASPPAPPDVLSRLTSLEEATHADKTTEQQLAASVQSLQAASAAVPGQITAQTGRPTKLCYVYSPGFVRTYVTLGANAGLAACQQAASDLLDVPITAMDGSSRNYELSCATDGGVVRGGPLGSSVPAGNPCHW
jgi:hypothetical protein